MEESRKPEIHLATVLVTSPLTVTVSRGRSQLGHSPVSPLNGFGFFSPPAADDAAARRASAQLVEDIARRLQADSTAAAYIQFRDAEAARVAAPLPTPKWWWHQQRWQGLETQLLAVVVSGALASTVLIACV